MALHPEASLLLVGESPPPGATADCASGTRLAGILGLRDRGVLLAHVPRTNIFSVPGVGLDPGRGGVGPWDAEEAASFGRDLLARTPSGHTVVALGRRVAAALGAPAVGFAKAPYGTWWRHVRKARQLGDPWTVSEYAIPDDVFETRVVDLLVVPHPSGTSTAVNGAAAKADMRRALMPELVLGCLTLRPWHFRLDEEGVVADLGAALCPTAPWVGAAAALVAAEMHKARVAALASPLLNRVLSEGDRPPWDEPLVAVARSLVDGGPEEAAFKLAERWHLPPRRDGRAGVSPHKTIVARASTLLPLFADYPVAVLRAAHGRLVARGVAP